ncbi:hypothetical protein [Methanolobus chelungpuianus]|uniref:hypothetical protein n=1 Tax=Methanolobus chelungpuianus TaxID=502115 RepID=UPI00211452A1|nr:hypothetical protein [Methanolobus chelungpuianus]
MSSLKTWTEKTDFDSGPAAFTEDDDADYRPMLQGVINTRCTYDGAKIEGSLE